MKKIFVIALIFFFSVNSAQVESSGNLDVSNFYPLFFIDAANYKSNEIGKTRVDIFIQVPYASLQFVLDNNKYAAKYSIQLTLYDEDNEKKIIERIWNEEVYANSFEETKAQFSYNYSYKNFVVEPGIYQLRCELTDKDSRKNYAVNAVANVADFQNDLNLSDIIFISKKIETPQGIQIVPNVSHEVTRKDSVIQFFYEIYSNTSEEIKLNYRVRDKNGEFIYSDSEKRTIDSGKTRIYSAISGKTFSLGGYDLFVQVMDNNDKLVQTISKKFQSKIFGLPTSINDLDKAIEQMIYIASDSELDEIQETEDYEEKLVKFQNFWKTKDPNPNTEENPVFIEYYRRVAYADEQFKNYVEGWRTDMGMIYILLGPPSNVERQPVALSSKPYEVWEYYEINRRFVFVDETGFGDYRLLNPVYGDWYRFRR